MLENLNIAIQVEYIVRIVISAVCGIFIGYERKSRGKGAGVRTHMIVSLAAALMMIISKYGFTDMDSIPGLKGADASRIASQIVSGIGFLGAGMIYVYKNSITGLTTAAGIWATSGIGMAVGAGMYIIGIATTFIIIFLQIFLHKDLKFMQVPQEHIIVLTIRDSKESLDYVKQLFDTRGWNIEKFKSVREEESIELTLDVTVPHGYSTRNFFELVEENEHITAVNMM